MNTINPTQIAQTIHNEYDTPVDMDPEYEYETDVEADTGIDLDLDQPIVNLDQDYSFLCCFDTLTQDQKIQLEQLASKVNNKDLEFPFDYRRTTDFDSLEDAINYLQGIQYFYKVLFNDFNDPDFKTTNFWLERHHMHPVKLYGINGGGRDEDDNLVRIPLAVHWLIHALHGDIAELLSDKQLAMHSSQSCQAIYRGVGTEERFYEFFKDVNHIEKQRLYDDVESSRKYWNKEKILESAKKYNTKKQWELAASRPYALAMQNKQLFYEATEHMFKMPISNSNNWQPNITCLYYYLLTNPTLTEHEYLTNDKFYHSLKGKPRNRSTEIKNFFNKYKKEFEAWIQDQITKGIRELDHTNNRYVFTKIYQK